MEGGTSGTNRHCNKLTDSLSAENLWLLAKFEFCFNPVSVRVCVHVGMSRVTSLIVLVTRILSVTIYLCLFAEDVAFCHKC